MDVTIELKPSPSGLGPTSYLQGRATSREHELTGHELITLSFHDNVRVAKAFLNGVLKNHVDRHGVNALDYVEFHNPSQSHLLVIDSFTKSLTEKYGECNGKA